MFTAYAAAKVVNEALAEAGVDKKIPPQMMYNYTLGRIAKGKAPFIAYDEKKGVDKDSLAAWIETYVAKQVAKAEATKDEEGTPLEGLELEEV